MNPNRISKLPLRSRSRSVSTGQYSASTTPSTSCSSSRNRSRSVQRGSVLRPSSANRTVKSPCARSEKRPVNDGAWLQREHIRIKQFMQVLEPNIVLKPLSTQMFIFVTDTLLNTIDDSIKITMQNYKEEIIYNLESFDYPVTASQLKTILKCPNIPHSFPKIIAIWSFLLDIIENDIEENPSTSEASLYYCKCFYAINKLQVAEQDECLDDSFIYKLLSAEGIEEEALNKEKKELEEALKPSLIDIEEMSVQNPQYMLKLDELNEAVQKLEKQSTDIKKQLKEFNDGFDTRSKSINDKKESVFKQNLELQEKLKQISIKLAAEPKSVNDAERIVNEIEQIKFSINLVDDRVKVLMNMIVEKDMQLAEKRREVQLLTFSINNTIIKKTELFPDFKQFRLLETGFARPDYLEDVKTKTLLYEEMAKKLLEECDSMQSQIVQTESNLNDLNDTFQSVQKEVDGLSKVLAEIEEKEKIDNAEYIAIFETKKVKLFKEIEFHAKLKEETTDLEYYQNLVKTKQKELKDLGKEYKTTLEKVDNYMKKQKSFVKGVMIDKLKMIVHATQVKEKQIEERKRLMLEEQEILANILSVVTK